MGGRARGRFPAFHRLTSARHPVSLSSLCLLLARPPFLSLTLALVSWQTPACDDGGSSGDTGGCTPLRTPAAARPLALFESSLRARLIPLLDRRSFLRQPAGRGWRVAGGGFSAAREVEANSRGKTRGQGSRATISPFSSPRFVSINISMLVRESRDRRECAVVSSEEKGYKSRYSALLSRPVASLIPLSFARFRLSLLFLQLISFLRSPERGLAPADVPPLRG